MVALERAARQEPDLRKVSRETVRHMFKKTTSSLRRLMWRIGKLAEEYRHRMYDLLALYAKPLCRNEPVICIDEKSLQLIGHSRQPLPIAPGAPRKEDHDNSKQRSPRPSA